MRHSWRSSLVRSAIAALLLAPGCSAPATVAAPPFPPVPPALHETMPLPPVSEQPLVWRPGHWDWNGKSYDWIAGAWVLRDGHSTMWMEGYWKHETGGWVWVAGHWM